MSGILFPDWKSGFIPEHSPSEPILKGYIQLVTAASLVIYVVIKMVQAVSHRWNAPSPVHQKNWLENPLGKVSIVEASNHKSATIVAMLKRIDEPEIKESVKQLYNNHKNNEFINQFSFGKAVGDVVPVASALAYGNSDWDLNADQLIHALQTLCEIDQGLVFREVLVPQSLKVGRNNSVSTENGRKQIRLDYLKNLYDVSPTLFKKHMRVNLNSSGIDLLSIAKEEGDTALQSWLTTIGI